MYIYVKVKLSCKPPSDGLHHPSDILPAHVLAQEIGKDVNKVERLGCHRPRQTSEDVAERAHKSARIVNKVERLG